ncbi:hypothetical protein [Anaerotignum sp.]
MAYEIGGRADKSGNRFETNWVIYKLLEVCQEKIEYVLLEAIGEDEEGVDLWIGYNDGTREGQQCKGRNASKEYWDYGSLNQKGIVDKWKNQLENNKLNRVSLVSPLAFGTLEDLAARARNTNDNPKDFLKYQIQKSGEGTKDLYGKICKRWGLDIDDKKDLKKSIEYLSQIYYRQVPDYELRNLILHQISLMFLGDPEAIYAKLLSFSIAEDIWGQKIDLFMLNSYFKRNEIEYRFLERDERVLPQINLLNEEYRRSFISFKNGIVNRKEVQQCKELIQEGKSIIIHGKAGIGKSGCTENIIDFCEGNGIVYLAIKLDKRVPHGTLDVWSKEMGLPASLVSCLHCFSKNRKAVLILDQLDALRWTQSHSGGALGICFQIINEIEHLNRERDEKISVLMICRSYDLENDYNIANLFKRDEDIKQKIQWERVKIEHLDEETIKIVLGDRYDKLSKKLKELVRIPSNLYILEKLDVEKSYDAITTTQQLIQEWWKQIELKARLSGLESQVLTNIKSSIVDVCEKKGRIFASKHALNINAAYLDFLCSNGFILDNNGKISFVHQSVLDCFLAEQMHEKFDSGEPIEEIVGEYERQNPGKRYQVQMFMQQLLEFSTEDFLEAGKQLISADKIRFNIKFIFLELLHGVENPDEVIEEYILSMTEDPEWESCFINEVIIGNKAYVHLLMERDILSSYMEDENKRKYAIDLLLSIAPAYSERDVCFIKEYIFQDEKEMGVWNKLFYQSLNEDNDELFDLRLEFYKKYPEVLSLYLDTTEEMKKNPVRMVKVLCLWLEDKLQGKSQGNRLHHYDEILNGEDQIDIIEYQAINELIFPLLPAKDEQNLRYTDWADLSIHNITIERVCIEILKKANRTFIQMDPNGFIEQYNTFFACGNELYNELILDAFAYLPNEYADFIIEYLCSDFNNTSFEHTSRHTNDLYLAKKVIKKYVEFCSSVTYSLFEEKVLHYSDPTSLIRYKHRIDHNKTRKNEPVYWRFWGFFQREVLEILPDEKMSVQARNLKKTLEHSMRNEKSIYERDTSTGGYVSSPVDGKVLTIENWKGILTSDKIGNRGKSFWKEENGRFIESTIESFSHAFSQEVIRHPKKMLEMILEIDTEINEIYINALYSSLAYDIQLEINSISISIIEKLFSKYPLNYNSERAFYFCKIIESKKNEVWSKWVIDLLLDIALYYDDPLLKNEEIINPDLTIEKIKHYSANSLRCRAIITIGKLIRDSNEQLGLFADAIERLSYDSNLIIRFTVLYVLGSRYYTNRAWVESKIVNICLMDYRMAGFYKSRNILFDIYKTYPCEIKDIIKDCYCSTDDGLVDIGAMLLTDLYILENEFANEVTCLSGMTEKQAKTIVETAIAYFDLPQYNEKIKTLLCGFLEKLNDMEFSFSRLFYDKRIDLIRDKEFLVRLMRTAANRECVHSFVYYLKENCVVLTEYSDTIFEICEALLVTKPKNTSRYSVYGVAQEVSKLIITMYDQVSDNRSENGKKLALRCMDLWDLMYKNEVGAARLLTSKMMEL